MPKTLAIQYADRMTLFLAPPLYWFGQISKPFIAILNGSVRLILKKTELAYLENIFVIDTR